MPGFERGYKKAIVEIVGGMITSIILNIFLLSGLLPTSWIFLFNLLNTIGTIMLILMMPYWGTTYLLGWMFALVILIKAGLVNPLEMIIYFLIPLVILIIRITKNIDEHISTPAI